ncbi:MAG: 2,3-bisphosphoglycerate-independent phosphoglycerate mutase [Ruminococcaceae bacterium]|nr:2,3-bisphosphoglycerate-independent phosphoglycerate mutase [Oscillospiraceae bacterium]
MKKLDKLQGFGGAQGPVVAIVLDGFGIAPDGAGNAVALANMPNTKAVMEKYPMVQLKAHGTAVGLPSDDDMGNSEVGHNALGSGQVFAQGAKLVSSSIESGKIFTAKGWTEIAANCKANSSTLHFIGLFSDGNVHSHIDHLKALIEQAKKESIANVRIHILLDGRDVGETSALEYVDPFEEFLASINDDSFCAKIASGGGRMTITMDRYEANWKMVEEGWKIHVLGEGRQFTSAHEAIETYRSEAKVIDQDLPGFVIAENGVPAGTINDGDSVIFFNFRGDRSIEISKAFEEADFDKFDRVRFPAVCYAGMLEYDGDLHIPSRYLVNPPEITNTLGEYLANTGVTQFAISETQKYGHVTYFWNGNKSGKYNDETETYIEIPSDIVPFEQRPWMKCAEITDKLVEAIRSSEYKFIRVNFPNGDMVGHTGSLEATIVGLEALDLCMARILAAVDAANGIALITADHGNADEMYEINKKTKLPAQNKDGSFKSKTSHTLNPVPCVIYDNFTSDKYSVKISGSYGLSNVAATVVNLMGYAAPDMWDESIVDIND